MGLPAAIIGLSPLIHEGEQWYKPYIVGDPPDGVPVCDPPFEKSWLRPCIMISNIPIEKLPGCVFPILNNYVHYWRSSNLVFKHLKDLT